MADRPAGGSVVVGRILGPWGVKGWVRVYSWTDPPEQIFSYQPWAVAGLSEECSVVDWRRAGPRLVAELPGIDSPEAAAALVDSEISIAKDLLPPPADGEFYGQDLEGLRVVNREGHCWGSIRRMVPTGAHDVMEVADDEGRVILIPFVMDHFVRQVDLEQGRIEVDWPLDWED